MSKEPKSVVSAMQKYREALAELRAASAAERELRTALFEAEQRYADADRAANNAKYMLDGALMGHMPVVNGKRT